MKKGVGVFQISYNIDQYQSMKQLWGLGKTELLISFIFEAYEWGKNLVSILKTQPKN